jgi:hypothetical protein
VAPFDTDIVVSCIAETLPNAATAIPTIPEETATSTKALPALEPAEPEACKSTAPPIFWQPGDWQIRPSEVPPYNQIKVMVSPVYLAGKLDSIDVTITDYTQAKEGAEVVCSFIWDDISKEKERHIVSPPGASTLKGYMKFRFLQAAPDHANLFLSLSYGLPPPSHKSIEGFVLQVPLRNP